MTSSIDELRVLAKQALDRSKRLRKEAVYFYSRSCTVQRFSCASCKRTNRVSARQSSRKEKPRGRTSSDS